MHNIFISIEICLVYHIIVTCPVWDFPCGLKVHVLFILLDRVTLYDVSMLWDGLGFPANHCSNEPEILKL